MKRLSILFATLLLSCTVSPVEETASVESDIVLRCVTGQTRCGGAEMCVSGVWKPVGYEQCANGLKASRMASVGTYSIGMTEVTRDQYDAWLATNPSVSNQIASCSWNASYVSDCEWGTETFGAQPVICVDWCDAYAYCNAIGRRLCGKVGGGSNPYSDYATNTSQWRNACTSGGMYAYPYGNVYLASACNGAKSTQEYDSVGTNSFCKPTESVYDLSGNVWEWEDSCDATGQCRIRGGAYYNNSNELSCDYGGSMGKTQRYDFIGFRCCS